MKNLNVKHYHQAYNPYNLPTNPHHKQQLQIQQHLHKSPDYQPTVTPTQRSSNNLISYNSPATTSGVGTKVATNSPVTEINNLPPTLGGYLANQQQQRVLQQQQQQLLLQQQQHLTTQPQTQQRQPINMLSLNQTNTYNYNFHFNAANSNNNNNNNNNNSNNNNNLSHNSNSNNHYNSALSRPQRPNTLNISAMASLATPGTFSASASANSSCHSASTTTSGFNFNPNQYYNNHRENVFNFPINHQQQQQHQQQHYNHNNYSHQQNYNNYNIHQTQQQQQQQQQLQLQLKQQQLNTICDLTTSVSATPLAIATTTTADNTTATNQSNNNNNNNCTNGINNNINNNNNNNNCDKLTMDACEIANFLANELFMQQLVSMECMQTGVPTLTTPTLTPTTLKSIEESFIQLTSEPINAPYQAGFIPPPLGSYNSITSNATNNNNAISNNNNNSTITSATTTVAGISPNTTLNNVYLGDISTGASLNDYGNLNESDTENSQESWIENQLNEENSMATSDNSSGATDTTSFQNGLNGMGVNALNNSNSSTTNDFSGVNLTAIAVATAAAKMSGCNNNNTSSSATTVTPRRGGGRRPATNSNMSPEEEEKRRVRRERNKLAAARCRKRRVDQTNELTDEVQLLEKKREELQKQIESLNGTKQNLEFILEAHRPSCQRLENTAMLTGSTFDGVNTFASTTSTTANDNITGLDTSLATTARSISPLDLKPVLNDHLLAQIKAEPLDVTLDSNSCLDQDGPTSPKRILLHSNNPMIPPPLPNVATLSASLAAASASLNTPIITTAPVSFASMYSNNPTLNAPLTKHNSKQRPNTLPTIPRNLAQNLDLGVNNNKPPTDINGVAIQTPSTGMFNFDSLMDGGTGLTPVSGPLVPNCSSQNKHPLELVTPTSEPSKLVSL